MVLNDRSIILDGNNGSDNQDIENMYKIVAGCCDGLKRGQYYWTEEKWVFQSY
ncbi:MAG: hypothetical protein WC556_09150 [Candidatus Methanoperedens sp.]